MASTPAVRDYAALADRIRAAAPGAWRVYGRQRPPGGAEAYDLLLVRIRAAGGAPRRRVVLNGGTHGDEPAGAEAVTRFLEERRYARWPEAEFTVTPCTNPWGYAHDRRCGPLGADLNRSFGRARRTTPEVAALKRALGRRTFDLFVDCHEDVDAPRLYGPA
jgi:predicted deacylase